MKAFSRLSGRLRPRPLAIIFSSFVIASILLALLFQPQGNAQAAAILTIAPLTWNVVGLDSNNVNTGPNNFPVGARVCNTGDVAATNVVSTFVWDTSATYIDLRPGSLSTYSVPSLAAGSCTDFYYEVQVTRDSNAYNTTRRYHITATADTLSTISTPTPREIFVEHLVSQNRNSVSDVKLDGVSIAAGGTMTLLVGNTYTIQLIGSTATNGYEQIESFINFPNTIFQVNSVATTYTANAGTDSLAATRPYADGCTWVNNPTSPNYRSCVGTGKYGGNITVTYNVTIIGGGGTSQTLNTLIYDFSGSSYHYNSDFSSSSRIATIVEMGISKAFSPASIVAGSTSTLTFTIPNPTSSTVSDLNFADTLPTSPAAMVVAASPSVTTSGCGAGTFSPTLTGGETSVQFTNGTIAANGTCTISVDVTVPSSPTSGTYSNTSDNLFIDTQDTGNNATADLGLTTASSGGGLCGLTLASWTFPSGSSATVPAPTTQAGNVSSAAASTTTTGPTLETSEGNPLPSWRGHGFPKTGTITGDSSPYFQFVIDTSQYTSVEVAIDYKRDPNWGGGGSDTPTLYIFSSTSGSSGTWGTAIYTSGALTTTFQASGDQPATSTGSSQTYFRILAKGANSTSSGDLLIDNVVITGCGVAQHPTLTKSFSPDPIAVNATSVLTFTLTNPNSASLTGLAFSDTLPAGLTVASTSSSQCGGTLTTTAPSTISFSGGTLTAGASCNITATITATTSGAHNNVSGFVSSTESGTNTTSSGFATDSLTALEPPSISKLFDPNPILTGETSMLTFTIVNPNSGTSLSSVAFSDTLPAGMTVASAPAASQCNGTVGSTSGSVTLTGGSIAAGGSCTVSVDVTTVSAGDYDNLSGAVTAVISGVTSTGNTASDTLTVEAPNPSISLLKQISTSSSGPWSSFITVTPGANVYYQFTIENTGDVPLSPVSVTDATVSTAGCSWPASLPVASPIQDPTAVCVVGPVTALAGDNPNTATAHGTYSAVVYDSNPSTADYLGASAGFSLLKQVSDSAAGPWSSAISGVPPGSNIYYKFTIINTGSLELSSINVTDPDVSTATCTFTDPLAVNDATTCVVGPVTASASPGTVTNTAVAHGTNSAIVYDTAPSSADYTVTLTPPDLTISKSNDAGGAVTLPTPFTWTLQVTNAGGAGDATFANGQTIVSDPLPADATYGSPSAGSFVSITNSANISCSITSGTLRCTASGAAVTIGAGGSFAVSLTVTPTASGTLSNTATVDPLGNVAESDEDNNSDGDVVTVSASGPEMTVSKQADVSAVDTAGDVITYTITLENTGNVMLTGVDVSDPLITDLDCDGTAGAPYLTSGFSIGAGSSLVCTGTYTVLQSDLEDNGGGDGDIDNTVTVASDQLSDQTASEFVNVVQSPAFTITKDADVASVDAAGDVITYTVTVNNTGNLALTNFSVSDPLLADLDCDGTPGAPYVTTGFSIIVGGSLTCSGTYTAQQSDLDNNGGGDGDVDNTVTGDSDETSPQDALETVTIVQSPSFDISKTADVVEVDAAGDLITYTITLENTGNLTLTSVSVSDPLLADLDCDGTPGAPLVTTGFTINLGATLTCIGTYTVLQSDLDNNGGGDGDIDNTATGDSDQTASSDASESVDILQQQQLSLDKTITAGYPYDSVGDTIDYQYDVENTGNTALAGPVTVSDDKATVTCPAVSTVGNNDGNLDPGESVTCTASYTIVQADLDAGSLTNTATASADGVDSNQDSITADASQTASFTLTKVADVSSVDQAGDVINYTITFTNTGNVGLTGVTITDTRLSSLSCTPTQPGIVAPAGTMVCTGSYTVTQADINAGGTLDNTATADSDQTSPDDASESVSVTQTAALSLVKSIASGDPYDSAGDVITYSYLVTNSGNLSLTGPVTIDDDRSSDEACPAVNTVGNLDNELDPGEALTCTASYTVTVADLNAGFVTNTADASADGTTSNTDSQTASNSGSLFDPPFGIKVFDDSGLPALRWTMTWINDANTAAVNAFVSDPIPTGTTYSAAGASSGFPVPGGAPAGSTNVGVTCEPDPLSLATTTTLCYYEGPTGSFPLGRIIWQGTLGPDLGATDAASADDEIVIRFNVVVDAGTTSAFNTATIDSDLTGDGDTDDPGEQAVATASAQWNLSVDPGVSSLPNTGFAPGRITDLPVQPDELKYAASDLILEVPRLGIKVQIVGVPYTASGWNVTWLGNQAGYLDGTAFPTWAGNSVITGHVYLANGLPGPFMQLGQLKYGDQLIVHFGGERYIYQVRENKVISPKDKSVFQHEQLSWITLVTCKDFNESIDAYLHRVAVRAVLVRVESDTSGR